MNKVPTVRQINWLSIIPHLIIIGIIIFLWNIFYSKEAIFFGSITYLIISYVLRTQIPKNHRKGMKLVKSEKFKTAIPYFEKSYTFFKDNNWIDKYRFITLLSSSQMTYQEMALVNIAFCYGQIGNGEKAKEYYTQTLQVFPENGLARAGLKMLNSIHNTN